LNKNAKTESSQFAMSCFAASDASIELVNAVRALGCNYDEKMTKSLRA